MSIVDVQRAQMSEQATLQQLLELYAYDFSEFNRAEVGADGRYEYRHLDAYWSDPAKHPFLFRVDGHLAGFALVRTGDPHDMAEFFVLRKYRRSRVGLDAARAVFAQFPGAWQLRQQFANAGATEFWRHAIPVAFAEANNDEGPVQRFLMS